MEKTKREKVIIMGAGGRDFHNFRMTYRDNPRYEVVAFTATQIPFIERRTYPSDLAGKVYPNGIPIYPEEELGSLIRKFEVGHVAFSYSDVSHEEIMHKASLVLSLGADFILPGPEKTMLEASVPVISVCAVRTGCGKSVISKKLALVFKKMGADVSVIRHPMAYCDFEPVKRFSRPSELEGGTCTIEEREEFEPLIEKGITVYAGIDYGEVLREAEENARVIIWDGGNNDFPFIRPDLEIVLLDALRPGHERLYYPGEVNLRRGHILIITKVSEAKKGAIDQVKKTIRNENPGACIMEARSIFSLSDRQIARNRKALVIEDGPTITHGGMPHGAGVAASAGIISELIDPKPYAVGSIKDTLDKYPHIGPVLPAMGYSEVQIRELEETISRVPSDIVIIGTPVDLSRLIKINKPVVKVSYDFDIDLTGLAETFLKEHDIR